jgi:hypothetical protein
MTSYIIKEYNDKITRAEILHHMRWRIKKNMLVSTAKMRTLGWIVGNMRKG